MLFTRHAIIIADSAPPGLCIKLDAVQVFYVFGLASVIHKLFRDPEWAAARGKGRDTSSAGFYGSREAVRLNRVMGGRFGIDSSSAWELGVDFGQIADLRRTPRALCCSGAPLAAA